MESYEVLFERVSDLLFVLIDSMEFSITDLLQQVRILFATDCALGFIKEVGQIAFAVLVYFLEFVRGQNTG